MTQTFEQLAAIARNPQASAEERIEACRALTCDLGDPRVDVLLDVLASTQDPALRFEAVYDLGQLGDRRAFEPFCQIVRDRAAPAALRGVAAELMPHFSDVDAVPVLVEALGDTEPMVRFDAAWALSAIGDARARPALEAIVDDPQRPYDGEDSVGNVARSALAQLAD